MDGTVEIYGSAYDATARADLADHEAANDNPHAVTKAQVGLGNADNTSDANKPVSTATATALAAKAPMESPALTGVPTAPTADPGTVTTQIASTAFAQSAANVAAAAAEDAQNDIDAHAANTSNPHSVTKTQVGLGNVDNTSDANKPISSATQTALNTGTTATATVATNLATHSANTSNPHSVTKSQVGLGSVDNTADTAKPVSTAQQTAINVVQAASDTVAAHLATHSANVSNPHSVTKTQIGLSNADNTSDANKPVSSAAQSALNLKANLAGPTFTGVPAAPTAAPGTNTTQVATTAYTDAAAAVVSAAAAAAGAAASAAQGDATDALADAAAAQGTADAAQTDATQALADAATAQAAADAAQADATAARVAIDARIFTDTPPRPGDSQVLFGQDKTGAAADVTPVDSNWVRTSAAGLVLRIDAATAADPQTIVPTVPYAVEAGHLYQVRCKVQRQSDPIDPLNDAVVFGIQWLNSNKGGVGGGSGMLTVETNALVVADGVVEMSVMIAGSADPLADAVAPSGSVYFRPFVDFYGDSHITDLIVLEALDVTASGIGRAPLYLPLLDADPAAAPGVGLIALYAIRNADTSATLRMQVGTDLVPVDIVVNVGTGA